MHITVPVFLATTAAVSAANDLRVHSSSTRTAFIPPAAKDLPQINPHPRILATDADVAILKATIANDPVAAAYYADLEAYGQYVLSTWPLSRHNVNVTWQDRWGRITAAALLFRLTGNATWAEVGINETLAVEILYDWGGPIYLQVAGLTYATALGYDWLHVAMNTSARARVRDMIIKQGINWQQYTKYRGDFGGFTNRNIVANTGYLMGALALWEENTSLAQALWDNTTDAMQNGLSMYDGGGWAEGFVYWGYATEHALTAALSIRAAFGSDFGFAQVRGLEASGDFVVRMFSNATQRNYAYADSGPTNNEYADILMWHHRAFPTTTHRPYVARNMLAAVYTPSSQSQGGFNASRTHAGRYPTYGLLFWNASGTEADLLKALPQTAVYPNISVVFARTNFSSSADPAAAASLLSFKGGGTYWSHNHRDLGSFAFESRGIRWALDLGLESYAVGGADNPANYRITTLGHNTLAFNGMNQPMGQQWCIDPSRRTEDGCQAGTGAVQSYNETEAGGVFAVLNLDYANGDAHDAKAPTPPVSSWRRGIATFGQERMAGFVVVDEFNVTSAFKNATWSMHTHATVGTATGSRATLGQDGLSLGLRVLEQPQLPGGTQFVVSEVSFPPPLLADPGVRRVGLEYTTAGSIPQTQRLVVAVSDDPDASAPLPRPLAEWAAQGPFSTPSSDL